jgi:hypothetical protein
MTEPRPDVPIFENYVSYKPRVNATKIVKQLLDTAPSEYLRGLGSIVLSSQTALSHDERRKKTWSRGKKVATRQVLGYYQRAWRGQPAYIVLYVDKICLHLPGPLAWSGLARDVTFGKVLFHEVGHHIHTTVRPEFKEREDVADRWGRKLLRIGIRQRHWYLVPLYPLVKPILFLLRKPARLLSQKAQRRRSKRN